MNAVHNKEGCLLMMIRRLGRLQQSSRLLQSSSSFFLQWSSPTVCSLALCFPLFTPTSRRTLTTTTAQQVGSGYIDEWYASIIKSPEFYEEHSQLVDHRDDEINIEQQDQPNQHQPLAKKQRYRCYFYTVDLQGRLFLEETMPKNVATCIKDIKFLNFFFHRLRPLRPDEEKIFQKAGIPIEDYPFVSPCRARDDDANNNNNKSGISTMEFNLVRPAATPFVFHSLLQQHLEEEDDHDAKKMIIEGGVANNEDRYVLVYGGDKKQPLDWTRLAISSLTGKLYHPIFTASSDKPNKQSSGTRIKQENRQQKQKQQQQQQEYALIRSAVAVALSDRIVATNNTNDGDDDDEDSSGMAIILKNQHDCNLDEVVEKQSLLHPIPWLPLEAEPGSWAMPYNDINE